MKAAVLSDRGLIRLAGDDARTFLNGLVTSDVDSLGEGDTRFAALLTPQGKIIVDFLVSANGDALLLDCPRALTAALAQKLGFYKLRAKVTIDNLSDRYDLLALWDGTPPSDANACVDPRDPALGHRLLIAQGTASQVAEALGSEMTDEATYDAHRIACGIARGGIDFIYGDAFPHETNMDRLGGVDFGKGCYVGQEVVSRMQHRGTARTRIVRVTFDGAAPPTGAQIIAGEKSIGTMGSSSGPRGLAMLRLDRAADAVAASHAITAIGVTLSVDVAGLQMSEKRTVA